jgi:hypothetical protein
MYSSQKAFYDESQLITAAKKRAALTAMLVHSVAHCEFSQFFTTQNYDLIPRKITKNLRILSKIQKTHQILFKSQVIHKDNAF